MELSLWLECDDEMKMDEFIEQFQDDVGLRKFAILNAISVTDLLVDPRSKAAIAAAEAFLSGAIADEELETAYKKAEIASDEIDAAHDENLSKYEESLENAALVALWAAFPPGFAGASRLESARDSALRTAFYSFKTSGSLAQHLERFKLAGLAE